MRHHAKAYDDMEIKPIRLKKRMEESGVSQNDLAQILEISRPLVNQILNKGYMPPTLPDIKKRVENFLIENNISVAGIWAVDEGAEFRMSSHRIMHIKKYKKSGLQIPKSKNQKGGDEDVNITKDYLDDMVLRHFGLNGDPFFDILDFQDIWVSAQLKMVERRVYDTIRRHGIMAIVGEIGAGKTTFLRYVLGKLQQDSGVRFVIPDHMDREKLTGGGITQAIISQLGGGKTPRSGVERDRLAKKLLEDCIKMGSNPVIVIDEAHDLRPEVLIGLKRVWDSGLIFKLLSIILVGQGGIDEYKSPSGLMRVLLNDGEIREFAERCYLIDLGTLNGSMSEYLGYRFGKVGGDARAVFTDKALQHLSVRARAPQLANNIAIRAMKLAYKDGSQQVGHEHVNEV